MTVTARAFSDALKAAMVAEKPLEITLVDGRQHHVLLPVSIMEKEVAFAGPYIADQRIVVAWNEITSLEVGGQGVAPHDRVVSFHDRLTVLLLKAELPEELCDPTEVAAQPTRAFNRSVGGPAR
jgi:hypothetical protein